MPAIVTAPPVKLPVFSRDGRSGPQSSFDTGANHQFVFEYSAPKRIYVVTWSFLEDGYVAPGRCRVFKSLDDGATWSAALDEANGPLLPTQVMDVHQDGNVLTVAYHDGSSGTGHIRLKQFTVGADTWGTASAAGPVVENDSIAYTLKIQKYASGRFRAFYTYFGGAAEAVGTKYADLTGGVSGGTWGAPVTFIAAVIFNRKPFAQLIYDPGLDVINVISVEIDINLDTNWFVKQRSITEGGVVSAPTIAGTVGSRNIIIDPPPAPNIGRSVLWNNFLVAPATYFQPGNTTPVGANRQVQVFMGTPASAPVWSTALPNTLTLPANQTDSESYTFVSRDGLTLYLAWVFTNRSGVQPSGIQQIYIVSTTDGVTWSAPLLYYDGMANPNAHADVNQSVHAISAIQLASGVFGFSIALQADIVATNDCVGYFLLEDAEPPPPDDLAIICNDPPSGFVGMAYSHPFLASGGAESYVSYLRIAGSLPIGLALNATTGYLTGTPALAGLYSFTVQVIDTDGNEADMTCSIRIFTVDNPSPCTGPPLYQLRPCRIADLDARDIYWQQTAPVPPAVIGPTPAHGVDPPSYYFTLGLNLMGLWQNPTEDLPGEVTYAYEPPALATGGDTPLIPEEYHESLVKFATVWLRLKEGAGEFAKTGPLLQEFWADLVKLGSYVRLRSIAAGYDSLPAELVHKDFSRLLKQILPPVKRTDADKPAAG